MFWTKVDVFNLCSFFALPSEFRKKGHLFAVFSTVVFQNDHAPSPTPHYIKVMSPKWDRHQAMDPTIISNFLPVTVFARDIVQCIQCTTFNVCVIFTGWLWCWHIQCQRKNKDSGLFSAIQTRAVQTETHDDRTLWKRSVAWRMRGNKVCRPSERRDCFL